MAQEQITIKTTLKAKKLIRLVSAMTEEKQYELLERLLQEEHNKVLNENFARTIKSV